MKKILLLAMTLNTLAAHAQVARKVIVEHFTNTYCSICANRNPGFYSTLWQYPQLLHIAYHPSSPYAACPLSQHNQPEADARTNFYGVFGGTPRIVVQGAVISAGVNYGDTTLYTTQMGQASAFELKVALTATSSTTGSLRVVAKKVAASSLTSMGLYAALVEDTLFFAANNGETRHYDVFRNAPWGNDPMNITAPVAIGDSVVYTQTFTINSEWNAGRIYAVAMLQDATKQVIQAEQSGHLAVSMGVQNITKGISVSPVPANEILAIQGLPAGNYQVTIMDIRGVVVKTEVSTGSIDVSALRAGMYILRLQGNAGVSTVKFIKE